MDKGWTRLQEQIEKEEGHKCEIMRRAFGLIISNNLTNDFDCDECELLHFCEG